MVLRGVWLDEGGAGWVTAAAAAAEAALVAAVPAAAGAASSVIRGPVDPDLPVEQDPLVHGGERCDCGVVAAELDEAVGVATARLPDELAPLDLADGLEGEHDELLRHAGVQVAHVQRPRLRVHRAAAGGGGLVEVGRPRGPGAGRACVCRVILVPSCGTIQSAQLQWRR